MRTVKLGLIGTGGIAQAHCRAISDVEGVDVVAASDIVPESLARTADAWGIENTFANYNDQELGFAVLKVIAG